MRLCIIVYTGFSFNHTRRGDGDTGVVAIGEAVCVAVNVGVGICVGVAARSEGSSCVCDSGRGVAGESVREELQ